MTKDKGEVRQGEKKTKEIKLMKLTEYYLKALSLPMFLMLKEGQVVAGNRGW